MSSPTANTPSDAAEDADEAVAVMSERG